MLSVIDENYSTCALANTCAPQIHWGEQMLVQNETAI